MVIGLSLDYNLIQNLYKHLDISPKRDIFRCILVGILIIIKLKVAQNNS